MEGFKKLLANERGLVLVLSLLILALLIGAGVGAIVSMQTDLNISSNLKIGMQAFYIADAGIERGKKTVKDSRTNPPVTAGSCAASETLNPGSFTVCYKSVTTAGSGASTVYTVTVESTGTVGNSSKTIESTTNKTFILSQAALAFTGNEADAVFTGRAFEVDGRDFDPVTGNLTGGEAQLGIAVPDSAQKTIVDNALSSSQKPKVTGAGPTTPSLDVGGSFNGSQVSQLATEFCNLADPANKFDTPTDGTLRISGSQTWGTRANPQIRCYTGIGTPGNPSVDVRGNTKGAGVLVVDNSDLIFRGGFEWEGLVIVTGDKVGFGILGGGNRNIYGSIFINETDFDPVRFKELVLQGSTKVRYSNSALATAFNFLPISVLSSLLPSAVTPVSWREVLK